MSAISPLVFLSPDGDFKNQTKKASGALIRVVMDPAAEAAAVAEANRESGLRTHAARSGF